MQTSLDSVSRNSSVSRAILSDGPDTLLGFGKLDQVQSCSPSLTSWVTEPSGLESSAAVIINRTWMPTAGIPLSEVALSSV